MSGKSAPVRAANVGSKSNELSTDREICPGDTIAGHERRNGMRKPPSHDVVLPPGTRRYDEPNEDDF